MIYRVHLNKKVRNIKVYNVLKASGQRQNFLTKLFMKVFTPQRKSGEPGK